MLYDFQIWLLVVGNNHEFIKPKTNYNAILTCWEDTPKKNQTPSVTQHIEYTDFPLPSIKLYLENKVLMLPNER